MSYSFLFVLKLESADNSQTEQSAAWQVPGSPHSCRIGGWFGPQAIQSQGSQGLRGGWGVTHGVVGEQTLEWQSEYCRFKKRQF